MKARLIPIYFQSGMDEDFKTQLVRLREMLAEEAEILEPVALGKRIPEADAVLFPQLLGDAFKQIALLRKIDLPMLILTSEFGTVSMWDWEIDNFLRSEGLRTFAPYNLDLAKKICRSLAIKREMRHTTFLLYQDDPGEGMQADIFKRFYWWENRCRELIEERFGVTLRYRSFKELGARAKSISDPAADRVWEKWETKTDLPERALRSAVKLYMAVKEDIEKDETIRGAGMNCLNESFYSDTTPCLAWNMLFQEKGIIWACEGDVMTLISKYILYGALQAPLMMSNVYPFLMGMAALKHERISGFPDVAEPENHLLVAHCGYLGVLPEPFSTEWCLRKKVLAIVNDNASAIDARLPTGPLTISKLHPSLKRIMVAEGELEGYAQYTDSDCLNGAVIRVKDGHRFMNTLYSHHIILMTGHHAGEIDSLARALDLEIDEA
jgi:hypothetical protein